MVCMIWPMLTSPPFSSSHASSCYLGSTHTVFLLFLYPVKVFQTPQDICAYCSLLRRTLWFLISPSILPSHHFSSRVFPDHSGQHRPNPCGRGYWLSTKKIFFLSTRLHYTSQPPLYLCRSHDLSFSQWNMNQTFYVMARPGTQNTSQVLSVCWMQQTTRP